MGALGGPIAGFFCVLVSGTFTIDEIEGLTDRDPDFIRCRYKIDRARRFWGICTPYFIGIIGGPVGSAILRAAHLADSISPLSAVRASALGGVFATPIYYIFWISVSLSNLLGKTAFQSISLTHPLIDQHFDPMWDFLFLGQSF